MLTREVLETRLEELRAGFRKAEQTREQAHVEMLTLDGATQECEWALAQLTDPDPPLVKEPD